MQGNEKINIEKIFLNKKLTPTQKVILLCIMKLQEEGETLIRRNTLMDLVGVSSTTINRSINSLKEAGILDVIGNTSDLGGTLPNSYLIHYDKLYKN